MQAELGNWNDERMDEFASRTEANFGEVRQEIREVRIDTNSKIEALRTEMNNRFAGLDRRFDVMIGALVSGIVGLILTHFVG
jgi:hypothetical protein